MEYLNVQAQTLASVNSRQKIMSQPAISQQTILKTQLPQSINNQPASSQETLTSQHTSGLQHASNSTVSRLITTQNSDFNILQNTQPMLIQNPKLANTVLAPTITPTQNTHFQPVSGSPLRPEELLRPEQTVSRFQTLHSGHNLQSLQQRSLSSELKSMKTQKSGEKFSGEQGRNMWKTSEGNASFDKTDIHNHLNSVQNRTSLLLNQEGVVQNMTLQNLTDRNLIQISDLQNVIHSQNNRIQTEQLIQNVSQNNEPNSYQFQQQVNQGNINNGIGTSLVDVNTANLEIQAQQNQLLRNQLRGDSEKSSIPF